MIYILVNPHSGDKKGLAQARWIKEHYPQYRAAIYQTQAADDEFQQVSLILQQYRLHEDRFLVIGGDGTLSKVLRVWPETEPLAYLPAGSGNDFARSFGHSSIVSLMKAIEKEEIEEIFVFQSENFLILNSLGLGFDARVIRYSEQSGAKSVFNRIHLGKLTYLYFGIRSLFSRESISVELTDEEGKVQRLDSVFLFVLANTAYFGGGIMVWPEASPAADQLDLIYLKKGSLLHHIAGLLELLFRKHCSSRRLFHQSYRELTLNCSNPSLAQIDGESLELRQEHFRCQTRRLYAANPITMKGACRYRMDAGSE